MRRSWLFFLLVFSLALNLGSLGALAYLSRQESQAAARRPYGPSLSIKELCRSLPLQGEQCRQFRRMMPEHQQQRRDLRRELARKRGELWELVKQDSPSWPEIQDKIKEISVLQGKLEEAVMRFLLDCQQGLEPGQRKALLAMVEHRLSGFQDSRGKPFGLRNAPGRRPHDGQN